LVEAARVFADLDIPDANGERKRGHLLKVSEQSGGRLHDPRLDVVPPEPGIHAWEVFWAVWNGQNVDYRELEAYVRLTGDVVEPWEVLAIRQMDGAVAGIVAERARGNRDGSGNAGHSGPITRS
jgi:hypothetical protein